jgi:hypothetical protein
MKHSMIARIGMRVLFVHLFSLLVEHLNAARSKLDGFAKPDSDLSWRFVELTSDTRLCADYKRVRIGSDHARKEADKSNCKGRDLVLHLLLPPAK